MTQTTQPVDPPPPASPIGPASPNKRWDRPIQATTAVVVGASVVFGTLGVIASAMIRTEKESRTFTTAVRQVEVRSDTGDLRITTRASTSDVIVNTRTRSAFGSPEHGAAVSDGVLEVTGSCPSVAFFDNCSVDFDLVVPPGTVVIARTSTGDVSVRGVAAAVTARSNTGDIEVSGLAGPTDLRTNTGDVSGEDLTGATVAADTDTGDVRLFFGTSPTTVRATTDTGDVKVRVPGDGTSYKVDSDVGTGDEKVTAPVDPNSPRRVFLRSSTGDVRLTTN